MSHNWIFINSPGYRRFIERSRDSRLVFWGATAGLLGAACLAADFTMRLTNPDLDELGGGGGSGDGAGGAATPAAARPETLARMPLHAQLAARANREQLRAAMLDVQQGTDAARYRALLDGKIHGTTHGTSMRPLGGGVTAAAPGSGALAAAEAAASGGGGGGQEAAEQKRGWWGWLRRQ